MGGPLRGEASCASCLGQEAGGDAGWMRFRAQVQAGAVSSEIKLLTKILASHYAVFGENRSEGWDTSEPKT